MSSWFEYMSVLKAADVCFPGETRDNALMQVLVSSHCLGHDKAHQILHGWRLVHMRPGVMQTTKHESKAFEQDCIPVVRMVNEFKSAPMLCTASMEAAFRIGGSVEKGSLLQLRLLQEEGGGEGEASAAGFMLSAHGGVARVSDAPLYQCIRDERRVLLQMAPLSMDDLERCKKVGVATTAHFLNELLPSTCICSGCSSEWSSASSSGQEQEQQQRRHCLGKPVVFRIEQLPNPAAAKTRTTSSKGDGSGEEEGFELLIMKKVHMIFLASHFFTCKCWVQMNVKDSSTITSLEAGARRCVWDVVMEVAHMEYTAANEFHAAAMVRNFVDETKGGTWERQTSCDPAHGVQKLTPEEVIAYIRQQCGHCDHGANGDGKGEASEVD